MRTNIQMRGSTLVGYSEATTVQALRRTVSAYYANSNVMNTYSLMEMYAVILNSHEIICRLNSHKFKCSSTCFQQIIFS